MNALPKFADLPHGYSVTHDTSDALLDQLIELSGSAEMIAAVPKDASERFVDRASFLQGTQQKQRSYYWLIKDDELAGIMWFHPKDPPVPLLPDTMSHTMSLRIYPKHQGRGLATPFMQIAHRDYFLQHPEATGIWVITDQSNERARHIYTKFGYQPLAVIDNRMVLLLGRLA